MKQGVQDERTIYTTKLPARITSPDNYQYAYLDDMGRYRVRLPFDLDTWSPAGDSRPVRLAKPYAGPEYGHHFPLHDGTEVMLAFVGGDPDRPFISGVMHDSTHTDHINNQWNTRNVIRTWANNKLRMEDKQGEEHIKLATEYRKTQLNLGHLVDSARKQRGDGFELRTDHQGAIRAGEGLFISTDAQPQANGQQLDMQHAQAQLRQALSLAQSLSEAVKTAKAELADVKAQQTQLEQAYKELKQAIVISAPAGIAAVTPEHIQLSAGENLTHTSGGHTDFTAGKNFTVAAGKTVSLFAHQSGIKAYAAKGDVDLQAHTDNIKLAAQQDVTVTSSGGKITIAAKEELLLTCAGGYIRLKGGNIELGCPENILNKSAVWQKMGPANLNVPLPPKPRGYSEYFVVTDRTTGEIMPFARYCITTKDGKVYTGRADAQGKTMLVHTPRPEDIQIDILHDEE